MMWSGNWRDTIWARIEQPWDVVVIGGGITGAAILREATRAGLRALLVEQRDFAWGTSSRSSKLVHGGFRYLSQGDLRLVRDSVRQRRRLLADAPGLVTPVGFTLASYRGDQPPPWVNRLGMALYDLLARQWNHQNYAPAAYEWLAPHLARAGLIAGLRVVESQADDARLVLRLIREAVAAGGVALNYARATTLLREHGSVAGVRLHDTVADRSAGVRARAVINATGVWVDQLRRQLDAPRCMRPLRGSHLVFPAWRFPVAQVIAFRHPLDRRYVNISPWEGATLVGTTDLDYRESLDDEPAITPDEVAYLMAGVQAKFPSLGLTLDDIVAAFSGVRPVVDTGKVDPSKESRDHLLMEEQGLLTVTGGKLTTFRLLALDALEALRPRFPDLPPLDPARPILDRSLVDLDAPLDEATRLRLIGRYGVEARTLVAAAQPGELQPIPGTLTLWAELRWAARGEGVVYLDDLLLRRVRLGLLLPQGGRDWLTRIRAICQPELGWDDARWEAEEAAYLALWRKHYSLPDRASIPDWHTLLHESHARRQAEARARATKNRRRKVGMLIGVGLALGGMMLRRRQKTR